MPGSATYTMYLASHARLKASICVDVKVTVCWSNYFLSFFFSNLKSNLLQSTFFGLMVSEVVYIFTNK